MTWKLAKIIPLLLVSSLMVHGVVVAQAVSEARGIIKDNEGNPLVGVKLVFRNTASDQAVYEVSTNKKGRFYIDNLLYYQNQEGRWLVTVEFPGVRRHLTGIQQPHAGPAGGQVHQESGPRGPDPPVEHPSPGRGGVELHHDP